MCDLEVIGTPSIFKLIRKDAENGDHPASYEVVFASASGNEPFLVYHETISSVHSIGNFFF